MKFSRLIILGILIFLSSCRGEDESELISINKSSIYIYDEFIKRDIKDEDKELIEALVSVLIFGNRNFLKWSDVYEKIKN
jgi:hypothetical protein